MTNENQGINLWQDDSNEIKLRKEAGIEILRGNKVSLPVEF